MKNSLKHLFETKKEKLLSIYFSAGYPALNSTTTIINQLGKSGVDFIEVGIPFSDPLADGPIIQKSGTIALKNGMNLNLLFKQLESIKDTNKTPLIMMGYWNSILQYGLRNFLESCLKDNELKEKWNHENIEDILERVDMLEQVDDVIFEEINVISTLIKDGTENDGKLEELNKQLDALKNKKPSTRVIVKEVKVDKKGRKL